MYIFYQIFGKKSSFLFVAPKWGVDPHTAHHRTHCFQDKSEGRLGYFGILVLDDGLEPPTFSL